MPVYDKSGNPLQTVYGNNGQPLNAAYSKDGMQIFPDGPTTLKVMSYNVQWFTKINSQQTMQNEIIAKYHPDIIGFQEYSKSRSTPTVGVNMLVDYPHINISLHQNYLAVASKIPLSDFQYVDYQTQDTAGDGSEIRAYMKGYVSIGGKRLAIFNSHLAYKNSTPKWAQMHELFEAAELEEYAILTGDFNSYALSASDDDYINMFKPFVDAGYKLANCSSTAGFTKTFSGRATATTLDDLVTAPDTIIVSGNIDVLNVTFDTTKLSYLDGNSIDHIPVIATLQIS